MTDLEINDNVFSMMTSLKMIKLIKKLSKKTGNLHGYYTRQELRECNNPIESLIDNYLDLIGDNSNMVEYWIRQTWFDMRCHQDLNEGYYANSGTVINPNHGHIFYLSESVNQASTLLFNREFNKMTVVTPFIGRVVRFAGDLFHYVPSPFTSLFGDDTHQRIDHPRYVLLVNTWDNYVAYNEENPVNFKINLELKTNDRDSWINMPIYRSIPLENKTSLRIKFMADSEKRFNRKRKEFYLVDKRLKDFNGIKPILEYEISKDVL